MARVLLQTIKKDSAPVGSIQNSMLTLAQFQTEFGTNWVLMNGDPLPPLSDYEGITGFTNVPDARGMFLRGKDHGATVNPDGDLNLGSVQDWANGDHNHTMPATSPTTNTTGNYIARSGSSSWPVNFGMVNGAGNWSTETRPKNITVNIFIKINNEA